MPEASSETHRHNRDTSGHSRCRQHGSELPVVAPSHAVLRPKGTERAERGRCRGGSGALVGGRAGRGSAEQCGLAVLGTVEPVGLLPRPHTKGAPLAVRLVQYSMLQQQACWSYCIWRLMLWQFVRDCHMQGPVWSKPMCFAIRLTAGSELYPVE